MVRELARSVLKQYRVEKGSGFELASCSTHGGEIGVGKADAPALLRQGIEILAGLQDKLAAQDRHAVLVIFQAMDAAGKDGAIKHAFSGLNPQGTLVYSFKAPTSEDLDRDFLRRHIIRLPARGQIGIHNRSWYEEVLVARVHKSILARQNLPEEVIGPKIWDERLEDIAAFERYLDRQGFLVLKFFLHVSKEEQRKRLLARIEEPQKNWKMNPADIAERAHWEDYQQAYQAAIRATATKAAPWFVIPADRKWLTRLLVVEAMIEALEDIDPRYPEVDEAERDALREAGQALRRKEP